MVLNEETGPSTIWVCSAVGIPATNSASNGELIQERIRHKTGQEF